MKVIITDASQRTALYVIRSLGRRGIDVTAVEKEVGRWANLGFTSKYVGKRVVLPSVHDESDLYLERLLKICHGHDVLFPISMYSLKVVSRHIDEFRKVLHVPVVNYEKLIKANNTETLINIANNAGIPTPSTYFIKDINQVKEIAEDLNYPVFIKVKEELELDPAKRNLMVSSAKELLEKYVELHRFQPFPLIQEYIKGEGQGYFAIFNRQSEPKVVFGHRRIREYPISGGPSTFCESHHNSKVMEYGDRLLRALNWYGLAMVEFKVDERDQLPKLMETNPRVWGSMPLAIASGVDFPYLLFKLAINGDVQELRSFKEGVKVRFLINDIRAALSYLAKGKRKITYLRKFTKDLVDMNVREGILSFDDPKPGLVNITKAIRRLSQG
jgi:predicted ATP-grasp superfamily ATP-dependent carboligase